VTDPIATLRELAKECGPSPWGVLIMPALAEIERRARIEARRDSAAADGWSSIHKRNVSPHPGLPIADHYVYIFAPRPASGTGPDYHTALEAALNAAGAP
jgi:hypothetical protein